MKSRKDHMRFKAPLLRPAKPDGDSPWAFVILPSEVSNTLPRRGRTSIDGTLDGHAFRATLEPDGSLGLWLRRVCCFDPSGHYRQGVQAAQGCGLSPAAGPARPHATACRKTPAARLVIRAIRVQSSRPVHMGSRECAR